VSLDDEFDPLAILVRGTTATGRRDQFNPFPDKDVKQRIDGIICDPCYE